MARTNNKDNGLAAVVYDLPPAQPDEVPEPTPEELLEMASDLGLSRAPDVGNRPAYREITYPDFSAENSYVISGPIGEAKFRGKQYSTWQEAKRETTNRFPVIQFWVIGYRWFARVRKPAV